MNESHVGPIGVAIDLAGGSQAKLGDLLGESQQTISNWLRLGIPKDKRVAVAAKLEQITCGRVSRRDVCPDDWHEIWPELAAERAPVAKEAA